jgi:peroxiredoxin
MSRRSPPPSGARRWVPVLLFAATWAAYLGFSRGGLPLLSRAEPAPEPSASRLAVGQALPELVLHDHEGRALTFDALRGQPVWLAFFRGADCEYCREQLKQLAARAVEVAQAGVQLLAVSPDPPATSARLRRELGLPFPLLSDQGEQAVSQLCGGLAHCQLLVDARGVVRWAGLSESWSDVPAPEALLEVARHLSRD